MNASSTQNREQVVSVKNGWSMLVIWILFLIAATVWMVRIFQEGDRQGGPDVIPLIASILLQVIGYFCLAGFFTLQPNEARVLILFGKYKGTVRESGFHWGNPFYSNGPNMAPQPSTTAEKLAQATLHSKQFRSHRNKISLRARNLNSDRLKVNDKRGNPIEIAAVVVWRVQDTAQAMFDVDDYETYVRIQSESAIRHLASGYAYDHGEENEITLRSGVEDVSRALQVELQARLEKAGVAVDEARLTHLAYAPEIAQSMLRRQQAEAVVAARHKIVHGAVSMVEMALNDLSEKKVVELDDDRRAVMVSNLMVVLCGESEVHPVVNTGTLYS